jgi:predicted transcriptional regulator of viral defense system
MVRRSRLSIAKSDIVQLLRDSSQKVFTASDLKQILIQNRAVWRLSESTTTNEFIRFLLDATDLKQERIAFPYRPIIRYTWGDASVYSIVQSINARGYFTHYSAMHFHGLTEQLPNTIYFNQEQQAAGGGGSLSQTSISNAFRNKCRVTSNVASFRGRDVYLLNGRNTNQFAVLDAVIIEDATLRVTNVERTLIDATARPVYSGGVFEVAKAFVRAHDQVSVNRLVATLRRLNFTYPYHQCIGFYLQRTGLYKESQLELLRKLPIEYDFYLDYGMKSPAYNAEWRLFIPNGF